MKYQILESQIDRLVVKYLNSKDFIQIDKGNRIYFVNSEGDKYAQIKYDKSDGFCFVNINLIKEISSFFDLEFSDSKEVIGRWVENTLNQEVEDILSWVALKNITIPNPGPEIVIENT